MGSGFINNQTEDNKKFNLYINRYSRGILKIIKKNKEIYTFIGLIVIMIIGIIIFLKVMSVSVLSNNELREDLIGKSINIDGEEIDITNSNLENVVVINRVTEKNKTDVVDVEFRVSFDKGEAVEGGTIKLNYKDNKWGYSSGDIGSMKRIEAGANIKNFIKETIQKDGVYTSDGKRFYGSSIKNVTDINCKDYNADEEGGFTASLVLSNGAYYENCVVSGKIKFNSEEGSWKITSVEVISNDVVRKEGEVDENLLKDIVLDEITDGSLYETNNGDRSVFISLSKDIISELNICDYIVRDDGSVRIEVTGKAMPDKDKSINLSGILSIGGNPSYGTVRNSKDIQLY